MRRDPDMPRPKWAELTWAALRGLLVGIAALLAAGALAATILIVGDFPGDDCPGDEFGCVPGLGPALLAAWTTPILFSAVAAAMAGFLRLPAPGCFAAPGCLLLLLNFFTVYVLMALATLSEIVTAWPLNTLMLTVLLAPYPIMSALAAQTTRAADDEQATEG
ncbi:hypothetical protein [Actinomadura sp. 9N407]|uniref:hypothetical protein n=1 Tax=Actinomadura sp. 9N407 TaxID=3375154 RepID=UPI00378AACAB